jgi:hypothetical protein
MYFQEPYVLYMPGLEIGCYLNNIFCSLAHCGRVIMYGDNVYLME